MTVTYGVGYPARELSRAGLDGLKDYDICFRSAVAGGRTTRNAYRTIRAPAKTRPSRQAFSRRCSDASITKHKRSIDAIVVVRT
jgi:hypothetical protein